jgi:predicted DNA-binding WGR domain protein
MPTEPVFLRWEHTLPPHHKFYEVEVELSLFFPKLLTRRWSRIGGKRPRSLQMRVADGEELRQQVAHISRRRQAHGYRLVRELMVVAIAGAAA